MALTLTAAERAIANGDHGQGAAMAMRIVAESARLLGAERLIPIASAHIDGALYHGDSGTLFAETLVEGQAKVAVRATLNVGALDLIGCAPVRLQGHARDMAKRLMRAYEAMGCEPSWTCAPYQAGHRPAQGSDVAWGESNAVAFCNSVLGARTNRYGDFLDIACAIVGRAPDIGLHRPENRRAKVILDVSGLPRHIRDSDIFWPVLGTLYGRELGSEVGAVIGLEDCASEDRLKSFGAAAASSGGVALFHIVGVTPEARDLSSILHESASAPISIDMEQIRAARDALSTSRDDAIDAVAIGSPHLSLAEFDALEAKLAGRKLARPLYACTGRQVIAELARQKRRAGLEDKGVILVADTCVVVTPILPEAGKVLMTNSGKFAHYAPGNTGYGVIFGSLGDCVESAVAGRVIRVAETWR